MNETYINQEIEKIVKGIKDKYSMIILKNLIPWLFVGFPLIILLIFGAKNLLFGFCLFLLCVLHAIYLLFSNFMVQDLLNLYCAKQRNFTVIQDQIGSIKTENKVLREAKFSQKQGYVPKVDGTFKKIIFEKTHMNFVTSKYTDFKCGDKVELWISNDNSRRIIHVVSLEK